MMGAGSRSEVRERGRWTGERREGGEMRVRHWQWRLVGVLSLLCSLLLVASCGGEATPGTALSDLPPQNSVQVSATDSLAPTTTQNQGMGGAVDELFISLAEANPLLEMFYPTYLPPGAELAESWWPMTELRDPSEYNGPRYDNPRVIGQGADAQVEVLYRLPQGWLVVLENFHGDVGETPGETVPAVAGCPAKLFEVNEGILIQWQKHGLWYGVFGRGVPQEELLKVAGGIRRLAEE